MIKNPKILSNDQVKFLDIFVKTKSFSRKYYLTGGTTLTEFYIPYRYSEDLDFFSETEIDVSEITTFLKSIKKSLEYKTFDIKTSFNRNIVMLSFRSYDLKLEFTYFPFPRIDETNIVDGLKIDSVKDIAVNKLFTIYQNPRSRDFIDLYMINMKYDYEIIDLVKLAKIKFDWHVDLVQLGSQFLKSTELKDYPRLITKLDEKKWQKYFLEEANKLSNDILK